MSFWNVLKKVGTAALGLEPLASTAVRLAVPGGAVVANLMDGLTGSIHGLVVSAEATVTGAKQGQIKSDAVVQGFDSSFDLVNSILAAEGKAITYDPTALQNAINATVSSYNAIAALKQTVKLAPVVQATPPTT